MKIWHGLLVVCCACGTQPGGGDDDPPPGNLSALERCVIDGGSLQELWSVGNQHGPVSTIAVGSLVVLGSNDGSVKQWSVDGDEPSYGKPFTTAGARVTALALGTDDVIAATQLGEVAEWRLADASPMRTNTIADIEPSALASDAARAFVGTTTGQTFVLDRASGTKSQLQSTLWGVHAIALAQANRLFTAGHFYGVPMIERRAADAPMAVVDAWRDDAKTGHVRAIAVDGEATTLAAAGDGFVAVLASDQLAAGPIAFTAAAGHDATGVVMLPGGALFATAGSEGALKLWKTTTAELVATLAIPAAIGIAGDAAGTRLYTSGPDGRLHAFACQ